MKAIRKEIGPSTSHYHIEAALEYLQLHEINNSVSVIHSSELPHTVSFNTYQLTAKAHAIKVWIEENTYMDVSCMAIISEGHYEYHVWDIYE